MMKQIWGLIASAVVGTVFLHCLYSGYRERAVSFRKIEFKRSENPVFYWVSLLLYPTFRVPLTVFIDFLDHMLIAL